MNLSDLINEHNLITDKNSLHSYCDQFYNREFQRYQNKPVVIAEIGIDQCGSLLLWSKYFKQAEIYGCDLQMRGACEQHIRENQNIRLILGNSYDISLLHVLPKCDIIIDDGPHDLASQIWTIKNLTMKVKPGGLLIIEDIADINYCNELQNAVPYHLKNHCEVIDLRHIKNRSDDILFVVRVPEQQPAILSGPGMDMIQERLSHIRNIINFDEVHTIVDIGAAHGYESLNMARIFKNATVYGFEPLTEHFEHCKKLKAEADISVASRLNFYNMALNFVTGPMDFYPLDLSLSKGNNTGMASKFKLIDPRVFPHELNVQRHEIVMADRLDRWCKQHGKNPQIIWMDAQGAELDILRGAEEVLGGVKVIMTEVGLRPYYEGHSLKPDIDNFLSKHGFVELETARKLGHEYEIDTIYVRS